MIDLIVSNLPWFWLGVTVLCIIIEACTFSLTTIWFAISAILMIFLSKTSLPFRWQLLIFFLLSIILIISTRPFLIKKLKHGKEVNTNIEALVGQEMIVIKRINKFEKGEAKSSSGVIWPARSFDNSEIPENTVCTVEGIEGNTLILKTSSR